MQYGVRELLASDKSAILDFLKEADPYSTFLMHGPARDFDTFPGNWMGALAAGTRLEGLACIEGLVTSIYAMDSPPAEQLGKERLRRIMSAKPVPGAYQIVGDESSVSGYWSSFKNVNRKLSIDRHRDLFAQAAPLFPPQSDLSVSVAQQADFKVVYEFTAQQFLEQWGVDPKRTTQQKPHEEHCSRVIAEGRQLIVRDAGKPMLLAEIVQSDDARVMLDRIYVSPPFRVRKKLVISALEHCAFVAGKGELEVLFFADVNDKVLGEVAQSTSFVAKKRYRLLVVRL